MFINLNLHQVFLTLKIVGNFRKYKQSVKYLRQQNP